MDKIKRIFATKVLRDKILFTIFILVVFRFLAHITIPGADVQSIQNLINNQGQSGLSVLSFLTGGAMENFSIILMGLTPYINASIIMQLLGVIVPSLENLKKEGEQGQKKISQYTRLLTVPLAFAQSFGMISLINRFSVTPIIDTGDWMVILPVMTVVTAGTLILMWLGELVTEKGIGNGISLMIFAGIVSVVPQQIASAFGGSELPVIIALFLATVLLTIFVVYVSEGERRVPIIYTGSKGGRQAKSFLPLKINQAGMIPIIFAISLVSFPSIAAQFMSQSESSTMVSVSEAILKYFNPGSPTLWYNLVYAVLIFAFTYFYVSIVFDPKKIAENVQKRGGYIPGYRPGTESVELLNKITNYLCFWGGLFLAVVAIFPLFFQNMIGSSVALFVSGAGIIIVVSVILDIIRRIDAHLVMQDYDRL